MGILTKFDFCDPFVLTKLLACFCMSFYGCEDNTVRNDKFYHPIIDRIGLVHVQHIDAKISPKAASEKAQTTVSKNRFTSLKIVFRTAILTLIAPTRNNAQASFLVHQVPCTFVTVLRYCQMFTQFSFRI